MASVFGIKGTLINGANIYAPSSTSENTACCIFRVNNTDAKALGNNAGMRSPRMVGSCESPFCNSTHPEGSLPPKRPQFYSVLSMETAASSGSRR